MQNKFDKINETYPILIKLIESYQQNKLGVNIQKYNAEKIETLKRELSKLANLENPISSNFVGSNKFFLSEIFTTELYLHSNDFFSVGNLELATLGGGIVTYYAYFALLATTPLSFALALTGAFGSTLIGKGFHDVYQTDKKNLRQYIFYNRERKKGEHSINSLKHYDSVIFYTKDRQLKLVNMNDKNMRELKSPIKVIFKIQYYGDYIWESQLVINNEIIWIGSINKIPLPFDSYINKFKNISNKKIYYERIKKDYDDTLKNFITQYFEYFPSLSVQNISNINGKFAHVDISNGTFVPSLKGNLLPLIFPKSYLDSLSGYGLLQRLMEAEKNGLGYVLPYYDLVPNEENNSYQLCICYRWHQELKQYDCLSFIVAEFDSLTVNAFKKVIFNESGDDYYYTLNLNEFLIIATYGSPSEHIGLACDQSCDLTDHGAICPVELPFIGLYKILEKMPDCSFKLDHKKYNVNSAKKLQEFIEGKCKVEDLHLFINQYKGASCLNNVTCLLSAGYNDFLNAIQQSMEDEDDQLKENLWLEFTKKMAPIYHSYEIIISAIKLIANIDYYSAASKLEEDLGITHPRKIELLFQEAATEDLLKFLKKSQKFEFEPEVAEKLLNYLKTIESDLIVNLKKQLYNLLLWYVRINSFDVNSKITKPNVKIEPFFKWKSPLDNTNELLLKSIEAELFHQIPFKVQSQSEGSGIPDVISKAPSTGKKVTGTNTSMPKSDSDENNQFSSEEIDAAVLNSQRDIKVIQLEDGSNHECLVVAVYGNGNCGFKATEQSILLQKPNRIDPEQFSRTNFIQLLKTLCDASPISPNYRAYIAKIFNIDPTKSDSDLKSRFNTWKNEFCKSGYWMQDEHYRLWSRYYNLKFEIYCLSDSKFIPELSYEKIYECNSAPILTIPLAHVKSGLNTQLNHFETIIINPTPFQKSKAAKLDYRNKQNPAKSSIKKEEGKPQHKSSLTAMWKPTPIHPDCEQDLKKLQMELGVVDNEKSPGKEKNFSKH